MMRTVNQPGTKMPIFEYRCDNCDTQFDKLLSQAERDKPQACPKCQSKRTDKMVSRTSFSLKGSGWAADGYSQQS